uniref:ATP synthase subunit a n=1 Tax=Jenufa perforata TaxID=993091 RepID=A0A6G7ITM2_9CHLO|nr:ATP synthase F0 subunit 6 [Jenufa perforata]QII41614.1 ATP synthase F0 subunit 6 [Jenufa perforata]
MSNQFFLFSQTEFWNSVPLITLQIPALETNFWFNSWGISVLAALCLAALNHSKNHKFASAYTSATSSLRKSILQFWSGSILDRIAISLRNTSSFSSVTNKQPESNRIISFWHSNLGSQYKMMYVWINVLFFLLIISNFFGLFPFFEAITGKTGFTIGLSFAVWFTVTFCGIQKQGVKMIKLFLPSGPHWLMSPIFVLLESISYTFRALSLGVRLWANVLSGHQLLHLFTGMALVPVLCLNFIVGFPVTIVVTSILIALTGLECIVCILQSGVFCILTSFYLNEVLHTKNQLGPKA